MILNRFIAVIFFAAISLFVTAQQIHFVYLQTENGQPFYVKLDNKVTSSSSAGYLILPKLAERDYNISVGFPKKEFPEESFQISVDKDNRGFLLKNFGEKGWGLFNLQSFAIVMGNSSNDAQVTLKNLQDDSFSKMLANVVKDSSILEKTNIQKVTSLPQKTNNDTVTNNIDTAAINSNTKITKVDTVTKNNNNKIKNVDTTVAINDTLKSAAIQNKEPVFLSNITRTLQKKNTDGIEMVYVDKDEIGSDTIRIFIPANKNISKAGGENSAIVKRGNINEVPVIDTTVKEIGFPGLQQNIDSSKTITENLPKRESEVENKDSVTSPISNNYHDSISNSIMHRETIDTEDEIKKQNNSSNELPKVVKVSATNSDCKAFASNDDFIKLRKKMAGENTNDGMIKIAKKNFRSQCFSTEQIKNLSFLFLNDEGKYQFFDSAYAFTSDSSQYHTLQSQLKDAYYVDRFKAMIHK